MSKRKAKKSGRDSLDADKFPKETRAAEVVTVAWMMAALSASLGTVLATAAYGWLLFTVELGKIDAKMVGIPFLFFFIAAITGVICLLLTPLALKLRRAPPPLAVTLFAVFFGVAPLIAAILLEFMY
jgi:hypothetical protein